MSLKIACDVCGKTLDRKPDFSKEEPDFVAFGYDEDEPLFEFEDCCEDCMSVIKGAIIRAIKERNRPVAIEKQEPEVVEKPKAKTKKKVEEEPTVEIEAHIAEPETKMPPKPKVELREGVIAQIPIKPRH